MKITEVIATKKTMLSEAKARIDHPEDIIFDENGLNGAHRALQAVEHAIDNHHIVTTIKWDGSPAVIFGWLDRDSFIVTDKAGIGAKKYNGRPTTADELSAMIYNRRPDQQGRAEYAAKFAGIYELLKAITPKRTVGKMFQGDMLWMTPQELQVSDDKVVFKPNKIPYGFDLEQSIGARIKRSLAGLAIHGMYDSADAAADAFAEPTPTTPEQHKITGNSKLIVFGPETKLDDTVKLKKPKAEIESVRNLLASAPAQKIDDMLDPFNIGALKISNLPELFKSFITFKARAGQDIDASAGREFIDWIKGPAGLTAKKQENIITHLGQYKKAYDVAWKIITLMSEIKHDIKDQLDSQVAKHPDGVRTEGGHEGYVSATPHGKIKFVNRPAFMGKGI